MHNGEIARALDELATLLELDGANPFRIRAYQNAARTVESHPVPLEKMVADGADLTEIPSIGKDMAGYITELVRTGNTKLRAELTKKIPASLIEITALPGLGAKRVRKLWQELHIQTVDDLERAAQAGQVAELEGFGAKSQQKILEGIAAYRRRRGRFKLSDADQMIEPLVAALRAEPSVERVEVAGSYRRRRETVGDVDILVIASDPEAVMRCFTGFSGVRAVEASGGTKGRVILAGELPVDLRILPRESYGAALQYFTGSKEHNVKLRKRALARGLSVSEYGVFETAEETEGRKDGRTEGVSAGPPVRRSAVVAGADEAGVYAALGLPRIPPELREDRGELEAAEAGTLPELITLEDLRGDLHMHSTWSDGKSSIEEMVGACAQRGYAYCAITDHSKSLAMTGGLDAAKLKRQWLEAAEVADRHPEIRLLRGMEVDILADGSLDLEDELLAQLDVVLVSVHSRFDLPASKQTERVVRALEHAEVNILAHPTGRLIGRRDAVQMDLEEVFAAAKAHGVIVELNAHPERLDLRDADVMRARELGLEVIINTDAHGPRDLALMRYGIDQARRAWLTKRDVVNTLPLGRLLERLNLE
jgi:DNA polymerase (family 10)